MLVRDRVSETGLDDDIGLVGLCPLALPSHLSLGLPAQPSSLRHLRRELREWLERMGVRPDDVHSITAACNEACTNAIEHPLNPRSQLIRLEADVVDGRLAITVRDSGHWRTREQQRDRGIGLRLMRELMDVVEVNRSSDGTEVRMTRTLEQPLERVPGD
jgi:anti-sigma regulatory factor (Ser/Thr protein kinase)